MNGPASPAGLRSLIVPSPYAGNGVLASGLPASDLRSLTRSLSFRLSAAVPSVNIVSIVTLSWTGRYLRLVPTDSTFLTLADETQSSLQHFRQDALEFISARDIPLLIVRKGPGAGPNAVSTGTTRMASMLLSLPIHCPEPTTQRVLGWLGRHNVLLPRPQKGYRQNKRDLQAKAIETAAFGMGVMLEKCREGVTRQKLAQLCAEALDAE